jgi:ComF family protein
VFGARAKRSYNGPVLRALGISMRQLLLPAHCAACGRPAPPDGRSPLCEVCNRSLADLIIAPYCPRCGRHAGPQTSDEGGCLFCRLYPIRHDATVRVGPYEAPLKGLILRLKYGRRREIAPFLGRLLAERLALAPWADRVDEVAAVPLHWSRRMSRGFNQAEMLARAVAGAIGGRPARGLARVRPTPHQRQLPAGDRRKNVRDAFKVRGAPDRIKGRGVLLVDDVMTSGTTVAECTRVLKAAGAEAVYVAVVATADYDEPGAW